MSNGSVDVYCPNCLKQHGRKKLLFLRSKSCKGTIEIACRGCKEIISIELEKEPLSRNFLGSSGFIL